MIKSCPKYCSVFCKIPQLLAFILSKCSLSAFKEFWDTPFEWFKLSTHFPSSKIADIGLRDFLQLQKRGTMLINLFDDTHIDNYASGSIIFSLSIQLANSEVHTIVRSSTFSMHHIQCFFDVVCQFHSQPVHTICGTKFTIEVCIIIIQY